MEKDSNTKNASIPLVENWLSHCEKIQNLQPNTSKAYRRDVEKFLGYISTKFSGENLINRLEGVNLLTLRF